MNTHTSRNIISNKENVGQRSNLNNYHQRQKGKVGSKGSRNGKKNFFKQSSKTSRGHVKKSKINKKKYLKDLKMQQEIDFTALRKQLYGKKQKQQIETEIQKPYKEDFFSNFETYHVCEEYKEDIISYLKERDLSDLTKNCLANHNISSNLRTKMVDWMIEVLGSYKCKNQSFFLAAQYMDRYFKNTKNVFEPSQLHQIGVSAMFMACKYEEIYPFKLKLVHEKIAHKKISKDKIRDTERDIMKTLNHDLSQPTAYEFMMNSLYLLNLNEILDEKYFKYLVKVCIYLAKMNQYDYDLLQQQNQSVLAASTIYVAFKIIEQLKQFFPIEEKTKELLKILKISEEEMINCSTQILDIAKNFDVKYKSYKNLKKFHSFTLSEKDEEKNQKEKLYL